jgi:hypothetical protein
VYHGPPALPGSLSWDRTDRELLLSLGRGQYLVLHHFLPGHVLPVSYLPGQLVYGSR